MLSAGVDYARVRALLARCEEAHGTSGLAGVEVNGTKKLVETFLPDLMVIDCESERLVPAGAG